MRLTEEQKKEYIAAFTEAIVSFKGHTRYPAILLEMLQMHSNKSNDYATDKDPFSNIELCERVGFPAWKGIIIRLGDKYSRLLNALGDKLFKYEGIRDAFMDNSCYSVMGIIEYEKAEKKEEDKDEKKE